MCCVGSSLNRVHHLVLMLLPGLKVLDMEVAGGGYGGNRWWIWRQWVADMEAVGGRNGGSDGGSVESIGPFLADMIVRHDDLANRTPTNTRTPEHQNTNEHHSATCEAEKYVVRKLSELSVSFVENTRLSIERREETAKG